MPDLGNVSGVGFEAWGDLESQGLGSSLYFTSSLFSKLLEAHRAYGRVKAEHPVMSLLSKESNPTKPTCTSEYRLGAGRKHVCSNHIQNSSWSRCPETKHSFHWPLSVDPWELRGYEVAWSYRGALGRSGVLWQTGTDVSWGVHQAVLSLQLPLGPPPSPLLWGGPLTLSHVCS